MTLSLARALGPDIRFMCVSPGAVDTDFLPGRDHAALEKIAAATPLKRIVKPEDVADAVFSVFDGVIRAEQADVAGRFVVGRPWRAMFVDLDRG